MFIQRIMMFQILLIGFYVYRLTVRITLTCIRSDIYPHQPMLYNFNGTMARFGFIICFICNVNGC